MNIFQFQDRDMMMQSLEMFLTSQKIQTNLSVKDLMKKCANREGYLSYFLLLESAAQIINLSTSNR